MFKLPSTFIGQFKIGDNIHYNLSVVRALYESRNLLQPYKARLLEKPITVLLVSICEALIHDLIYRARNFTNEGLPSLDKEELEKLRTEKSWRLEKKVELIGKLDVLRASTPQVYEFLKTLATLRNRLHIQNEHQNFEANEAEAFTEERRILAEQMVEFLIRKFNKLYPRPSHIRESQYVNDFSLPWEPHFGRD